MSASRAGHLEIVKLLLKDKRVNSRARDDYAMSIASPLGHTEIVAILPTTSHCKGSARVLSNRS
jgi:hypothetical protein